MKTAIKYQKLAKLPREKQLQQLTAAAGHELGLPAMAADLAPRAVVTGGKAAIAGMKPVDLPGHEQIKRFLATKYAVAGDTPELVDVANEFEMWLHTNMPELDMAWSVLFDTVDLRTSPHSHFDILDTNAGITFNQRKPGANLQIRRHISEAKTTVDMLEFADGLGLLDVWLEDQMFWRIDDALAEFRAQYFEKMAELHYQLFTALGAGIDVAFDTDDVTTANKAMGTILRNVRAKGYGVSQNSTFYALTNVEKVGRLEKMLTAQRGSAIVDNGTVDQPLTVRIAGIIGTTHIPSSETGWYLVLPGRKIKRGVKRDLTVEDARNIYASATDMVATGRYNAAIGDSDQVARCKFA